MDDQALVRRRRWSRVWLRWGAPAGALICAGASLWVLYVSRESDSTFWIKFLIGASVAGAILGGLAAFINWLMLNPRTPGLATATVGLCVTVVLLLLRSRVIWENPPADELRSILRSLWIATAWSTALCASGIATYWKKKWGETLQFWLMATPLVILVVVLGGAMIQQAIITAIDPRGMEGVWRGLEGVYAVLCTCFTPFAVMSLFLFLFDRSVGVLLLVMGLVLFSAGASLGDWLGGMAGHPVIGAYVGAGLFTAAAFGGLMRYASSKDKTPPYVTDGPDFEKEA